MAAAAATVVAAVAGESWGPPSLNSLCLQSCRPLVLPRTSNHDSPNDTVCTLNQPTNSFRQVLTSSEPVLFCLDKFVCDISIISHIIVPAATVAAAVAVVVPATSVASPATLPVTAPAAVAAAAVATVVCPFSPIFCKRCPVQFL